MSTTYSTSLKLNLIGNGEQSGIWGTTTNTNWNMIEQSVAGVQTITMANTNYTLIDPNGTTGESHNMVLVVAGTNSAIRQVIAPLVNKFYVVSNQTVGGYAITIGGATGSLVTIPNGTTAQVYCDSTNFYSAITSSAGSFNVPGNLTLASLTGILKASSGAVSTATAGTDYAPATSGTAILKGNGAGGFSNAAAGTDYAPATSGNSILYGNGSGGFSNVSVGTGLSFAGGTLSSTVTGPIPATTRMLFVQPSAPVGWTQITSYNNYALRVVSGTGGGTGGSVGFTSAFASQAVSGSVSVSGTVGGTTLTTAQIPSHSHSITSGSLVTGISLPAASGTPYSAISSLTVPTIGNTGGGGSHDHSFSGSGSFSGTAINLAVQYVDTIICSKD